MADEQDRNNKTVNGRSNNWYWRYIGTSSTSCDIEILASIDKDHGNWTYDYFDSGTTDPIFEVSVEGESEVWNLIE